MREQLDYDPITGQELEHVVEDKREAIAEQALSDMNSLVALAKHPGWILIKDAMQRTIEKENQNLLHATHIDSIHYFQAQIKARQDLLGWLEIKILEGKQILEERAQASDSQS